jgi:gentisate 1,2-dioxygenase
MNTITATAKNRRQLYDDMSAYHLTPLWEVLHALVPQAPHSSALPAFWSYDEVRPFLMRAGELITAHEAIRRVLILENPALRGQSATTQALYAGLQLILPGEVAPSHRHTQSALRFIVEGQGAYTAVNGERTTMKPGDFIITPSWTWHDHGHEQAGPVVWLDGLDIPLIRFLDAGFAENGSAAMQEVTKAEGSSFAQFGYNMAPVRTTSANSPMGLTSPIFSYPYDRTREALDKLERQTPIDACDGFKLRYINPLTGGSPMPTMATFMQRLPPQFRGQPYRQTDGTVMSVVEGSGIARLTTGGGKNPEKTYTFPFKARDHFVIPSWTRTQLESDSGCVLFSYSDLPVQQALGLYREER